MPKITGGRFGVKNTLYSVTIDRFKITGGRFGEKAAITNCEIHGGTFYQNIKKQVASDVECYTVTYEITETVTKQQYVVGEGCYASAPSAKNDKLSLRGWYLDDKYQKPYDFSQPVSKSFTLYAKREKVYGYVTDQIGTVVEITESNRKDVLGDGSVHFVQTREGGPYGRYGLAGTVTLNNAALEDIFIYDDDAYTLTLELQGKNRVRSVGANYCEDVLLCVTGTGSLDISYGGKDMPILARHYEQSGGHVTIEVTSAELSYNYPWYITITGGTLTARSAEQNKGYISRLLYAVLDYASTDGIELRVGSSERDTLSTLLISEEMEERKKRLKEGLKGKYGDNYWEALNYLRVVTPGSEEPEIPELPIGPVLAGGVLLAGDSNPFRDVRAIDWFYDDVMYAYEKGLMSGTAQDKFSPQASFTRGMLRTILARHDGMNTNGTPWYQAGCDWAAKTACPTARIPGKQSPARSSRRFCTGTRSTAAAIRWRATI